MSRCSGLVCKEIAKLCFTSGPMLAAAFPAPLLSAEVSSDSLINGNDAPASLPLLALYLLTAVVLNTPKRLVRFVLEHQTLPFQFALFCSARSAFAYRRGAPSAPAPRVSLCTYGTQTNFLQAAVAPRREGKGKRGAAYPSF